MPVERPSNPLLSAAVVFLAANLLHTADHLRQGLDGLTWEILSAGTLLTVEAAIVVVLAARRSPNAPPIAAVVGLTGALGIAASHFAPHWSALSDSYPQIGADAISWTAALLECGAALGLAATAAALLSARAPGARMVRP